MKVLNPTVTIMLASHMKPDWLPSALESILSQTRRDIQVVVADSGAWIGRETDYDAPDHPAAMEQIYHRYEGHPLIEWVTVDQAWPTPLPERACPYTYVWNRIIEANLVRGKYVAVFTDDDLYAPTFVERMAGYLDEHPDVWAVYCGQERSRWEPRGEDNQYHGWMPAAPHPAAIADRPRGPGEFHWQVDMTQVMFRRDALDEMRCEKTDVDGLTWSALTKDAFNEDPDDQPCRSADGEFLERLATLAGVVPNIPETLVTHRYTPDSTYN
jgi:glycosyltransferase involved in cell wall biosynthesis